MKSEKPIILLKEISKSYSKRRKPSIAFWRAIWKTKTKELEQKVLSNVNLSIFKGETVGIIGRNGAGKSTLLQIITGILPATSGTRHVTASISAMLELGAGFNPEFNGIENIRLSLAMRGIPTSDRNIKNIIEFSELGDYIYMPLKTYSSGMHAKLAFSVNIALTPEVLIVDEALSVGDIFFQAKCIKWIDDFRENGGTVLFVTHDTYTVERICNRVILLERGSILYDGSTTEGIKLYYRLGRTDSPALAAEGDEAIPTVKPNEESKSIEWVSIRRDHVTGNGDVEIVGLQMTCSGVNSQRYLVGESAFWMVRLKLNKDIESFQFGFGIRDKTGILIGGAHTFYSSKQEILGGVAGDIFDVSVRIDMNVAPGEYFLLIGAANHRTLTDWTDYCTIWDGVAFSVAGAPKFWGGALLQHQFEIGKNVGKT